ncbi:MAG: hypothetical protein AAFW69_06575 [Pseudomonadota bacterium]
MRRARFILALPLILATSLGAAAQERAQAAERLLTEALSFTGPTFEAFMQTVPCSPELERQIFELTRRNETLARLAEKFGTMDPWRYRSATINCRGWNG